MLMIDSMPKVTNKLSRVPLVASLAYIIVIVISLLVTTSVVNAEFKRGENPSPVSGSLQSNSPTVSPNPSTSPNASQTPQPSAIPQPTDSKNEVKDAYQENDKQSRSDMTLWLVGGGALLALLLGSALWLTKKNNRSKN